MTVAETFRIELDGDDWRLIATAIEAAAARLLALKKVEAAFALRNLHTYIIGQASGTVAGEVVAIRLSVSGGRQVRTAMEQQAAALCMGGWFSTAGRLDDLLSLMPRVAS